MTRLGQQFGPDFTFLGVPMCDLDDPSTYGDAAVVILGAPFDGGTSHRPGARFGPMAIRMQDYLPHDGSRPSLALRTDGLVELNVKDAGDVEMYSGDIERALGSHIRSRHSASWKLVARRAMTRHDRRVTTMHEDELAIDTGLVRHLVDDSFPEYANLALAPLPASGSSNALFRLGDELLVRLPRQPGGSATIKKEARWLPMVASALTTSVPEIIGLGEPGFGYAESWAVTRWIDGHAPAVPRSPSSSSTRLPHDLARLVTELRAMTVPSAARSDPDLSWYRGGRLAELDDDFCHWVGECRLIPDLELDLDLAQNVWDQALTAELAVEPNTVWYHGDLFAENLLVRDGALAAVLDFGGLSIGDGTVDLTAAWELFDVDGREIFWQALDVDDSTRVRSMGWALLIALMTFPYYWHTMPARCAARRTMAVAVLAEATGRGDTTSSHPPTSSRSSPS